MAVAEPVSSESIFLILLVNRMLPVADFKQSGDRHQFRFRAPPEPGTARRGFFGRF
jgi:hypothetical protein